MFNDSSLRCAWEGVGQFQGQVKIDPALAPLTMSGILIPREVLQLILRNLSPKELGKICTVCKVFNEVASSNPLWNSYDLRKIFPNATFITKEDWQTYYGLVLEQRGRPCVDKIDYIELKKIEAQVEGGMGFTVIEFLPNDTIIDALRSAASPKAGNPVIFQFFSSVMRRWLGGIQSKAVIVAMTNNIFIDSGKGSVEERKQILKDMKCKAFGVVAATRLATMRFCMSPQGAEVRLFSGNPLAYTLCIDEKKDETTGETVEVISQFGHGRAGPQVYLYNFDYDNGVGVAGLRELKVIDETKNASSEPIKKG